MFLKLFYVLFFLFFGCVQTNEKISELVEENSKTTKTLKSPSDLGNQAFKFTPESYNFGNRAVNSAPISTSVTIKNITESSVYLSNMSGPNGAFNLDSDNCPRSPNVIAPNQTCTATLSFAPNIGGILNSSLSLTYGSSLSNTSEFTATMALTGTGVGTLSFNGIDSVSNIYATQLKLNWTHVSGTLIYYVFKVNNDNSLTLVANVNAPATSYIVSGLTASTSYKFWVRAMDTSGAFDTNTNTVTTSTNTSPAAPALTGHTNYTFASSNPISLGSTVSFNFDDNRTGVASDAGVTYSCYYDQVVDGTVSTSSNCSSLPGTISFGTTTGALSWTPTTQAAIGFYEINTIVTDNTSGLTNAAISIVDIKPTYLTSNLVGNFSANFSNAISNQSSGTTWQDLTSNNHDGTLTNFTFGGSYGWLGAGTYLSPYRLSFDGTNDFVTMSTSANSASSLTLETWAQPAQISTTPSGIIMSNADSSSKGIMLREAKGYRNRVEAVVGSSSYVDEVLADLPVSYLRLGDASGSTIYDAGSAGLSWTAAGVTTYEATGAISGDKGMVLSGAANQLISGSSNSLDTTSWSGLTYELWYNSTAASMLNHLFVGQSTWNTTTAFFNFYINGSGQYTFAYTDGAVIRTNSYNLGAISQNTWYHLVLTYDFSTNAIKIYINGANVLNTTTATTPVINNMNASKILEYGELHAGPIDEIAVYNYPISSARVTAHYNAATQKYSCLSKQIDNALWHHLTTTFDEFTGNLKLYTNGDQDCSVSTTGVTLQGTSADMSLGAKVLTPGTATAGTYFHGEITDARAYSTAISSTQVATNMMSQADQFQIPKSHSGLIMWYDASDISTLYQSSDCTTTPVTTNGNVVACWKDKSGNNNHATQATTAQMPTYKATNATFNNKSSLTFGASAYSILTTGSQTVGQRTYFVVTNTNGAPNGSYHSLILQNATKYYQLYENAGTAAYYVNATGYNSTTSYTGRQLHALTHTSSTATYRVNQTQVMSSAVASSNLTSTFSIGGYAPSTTGLNGEILEVIVYNRALSSTEVYRIESYLKAKYSL